MSIKEVVSLFGCIFLSFLAGIIGSVATTSNIASWYSFLDKPPFLPPNWVFGPVWTLLYIFMGIALFLVLKAKGKNKQKAYWLFGIQLVLNTLWSLVFFGAHLPWAGVVVILALLVTLLFTYREFIKFNKAAAYLFIPYIAWVCFATYLNTGVALLN